MNLFADEPTTTDRYEPEPLTPNQYRRWRERLLDLPENDRRELRRVLDETLQHDTTDNTTHCQFRLPRAAKFALSHFTGERGMTTSEYCRRAVLAQLRHDVGAIN